MLNKLKQFIDKQPPVRTILLSFLAVAGSALLLPSLFPLVLIGFCLLCVYLVSNRRS